MRLLATIQPPDATQAMLECLDLPSRAPPTAPAHPDPDDTEAKLAKPSTTLRKARLLRAGTPRRTTTGSSVETGP